MAPSISNIFATVTKASKATVSYAIAHPKTSLGLATTSMTLGVFGPENLVRKPVNGIGFDREGVRASKCIWNNNTAIIEDKWLM